MHSRKLHILFLPTWYPHKFDAMFGLFVRKHAEAVAQQHRVSVLYLHAAPDTKTEIERKQTGNLHEWHIYYAKSKYSILYLCRFLHYFFKYAHLINKEQKVDVTHVHVLTRMGALAYVQKILFGIPYIITEHWSRYLPSVNGFSGFWRKKISKIVVKQASAVLPVSQNLAQAMQAQNLQNHNYQIVNNVVDDVFFKIKHRHRTDKIRAIHVSTFEDKSKNISGILRNIANISQKRQDFELIFVGIGIDYKAMYKLAKQLKLLNTLVYFKGELDPTEVAQAMVDSDFLLMYSNYENMPVVISEAMACGLPVLTTDVGGIHEHMDASKGILCPPKDDQEFCIAFEHMLNNYQQYDKSKISSYAQQQFSYQAVADKLNCVYQTTLTLP